jgi:hypothetical protein
MMYKRRASKGFSERYRYLDESPEESPTAVETQKQPSHREVTSANNQPYWFSLLLCLGMGVFMLVAFYMINNFKLINSEDRKNKNFKTQSPDLIIPKPKVSIPIIHIQTDDRPDSAINNQDLENLHCKISQENYQIGDIRSVVDFSSEAETIVPGIIIEKSTDGNTCNRRININKPTHQSGTSIVLALEHILNLIESFRNKGRLNNVLVTLTIHQAEPGPGQPLMNAEGLQRMEKVVKALEREKTLIVVFGATGELKKQLAEHFRLGPYQRVCPSNDLNSLEECMANAFRAARNWSN